MALPKFDDSSASGGAETPVAAGRVEPSSVEPPSAGRSILAGLVVTLFGIALALLIGEGAIRLIELRAAPVVKRDRPKMYYRMEGSTSNREGRYAVPKPEGTFRVAVVGDSVTFAPAMQYDDAFPKRLERMLNMNEKQPRIEVLNYGVSGTSTYQQVDIVREAIGEGADTVLLQITLNDPEVVQLNVRSETNKQRFGGFRPQGLKARLCRWSHLYCFVARRLHNSRTQREYREYFFKIFEDPRGWGKFTDAVSRIASDCARSGVRFGIVVFPLFGYPLDGRYPFEPLHAKIAALAARSKLSSVDLLPVFRNIPIERLEVIPGFDRHPNEIAHRLAAERIYQFFLHERLVPREARIKLLYKNRQNARERLTRESAALLFGTGQGKRTGRATARQPQAEQRTKVPRSEREKRSEGTRPARRAQPPTSR